jgi:serine/threonine-protein kinase
MTTSVDAAKKSIRGHVKANPELQTPLGALQVGKGIGEGANALVFRARWGRKDVAAKFLAEDCSGGLSNASGRYKRFVDEFRELVQLSHSGAVVSMYQFGLMETGDGEFPYVLMELCPQTLRTWRADNPVGSLATLLPILLRLMSCLKTIHQHNMVHRDLKPENVLLNGRGELVLADFGIAWFDPDHYERLASTGRGERLANRLFSAPEQSRRNPPRPDPTMDIYALGQLIQWLVTGEVHAGTGRRRLEAVDSSFARLDPLVEAMLREDPRQRPQTIEGLEGLLDRATRRRRNPVWEGDRVRDALVEFDGALADSLPGGRGLLHVTDQTKIDRLLSNLAKLSGRRRGYGLWWNQGVSNLQIDEMRKLDDTTWLIGRDERRVDEAWVYKGPGYGSRKALSKQYVLLNCAPMPSFGLSEPSLEREEAAWFRDRYISRTEYDDDATEIENEVVRLGTEAELRTRNKTRDFVLLGTNAHSICLPGREVNNDKIVRRVYEDLLRYGEVKPDLLAPLEDLEEHASVIS